MRSRLAPALIAVAAGFAGLTLLTAQVPPPPPAPPPVVPAAPAAPAPARDPEKMSPLQRQMWLGGQRGAEWLCAMNGVNGRFRPGWYTALNAVMDQDSFHRQAGAAFALARAARLTGDKRYAARATQAVLVLLEETAADPANKSRATTLPSIVLNRLGAAALLVAAINELPAPPADLLDQSDQLCHFIAAQARPDGSLGTSDPGEDGKPTPESAEAVEAYPGPALYALMLSQRHRPAAWKTDVARKAVAHYRALWREKKSPAMVPGHTAAYAEAYLATKEAAFAEAAAEMNDWLAGLQYDMAGDARRPLWSGGFKGWQDGKPVEAAPTVQSAAFAESLAHACRVARAAGDAPRYERYHEALVRALQFLTPLQFTDANTGHFDERYRARLLGGFHLSHTDGNLRLDYNQHAVSAFLLYVEHVGGAAR